ncbi:MAG: type I-E CRISPR-associated protein Cas6/Cse3/CasE [Methylomonas sp.]|nr:MAG: type I-E CRISPR-associated protein Cas6/Cse3/CasE [Methylomonas sp.]
MYFSRVRIRTDILKSSQLGLVLQGNSYGSHRLLWDLFPDQDQRTFLYREEIACEQLAASATVRGEPIYYVVSQVKPVANDDSLFRLETKSYQPQLAVGQCLAFECRVNPVVERQGKKHDVVMDAQLQFLSHLVQTLNLQNQLVGKPEKSDYKTLLLSSGGEALNAHLNQIIANDLRYAERLSKVAGLSDKLEWAIKALVDKALETWLQRQGERCGFELVQDQNGLSKLQNSGYQWHGLPQKTKQKGDKSGFSAVDLTGELQITDIEKFQQALFNGLGRSKAFGCGLLMIKRV